MDYKVVVTRDAEEDLEHFVKYLIMEKESTQAAENVLNDYVSQLFFCPNAVLTDKLKFVSPYYN